MTELRLGLRRGRTVKTLDVIIATYALAAGVPVLAADRDFAMIARAGVLLGLA